MVEILKPLVPLLVKIKGNVSDLPTITSPNCKLVGLKDKWIAAAAGFEYPAVNRKAMSDRKNVYLCMVWGRVITFSVCRQVRDQ